MADSPPASDSPQQPMESPPLPPSPSTSFGLEQLSTTRGHTFDLEQPMHHRGLSSFPTLSPLPSPTQHPSSLLLLLPAEANLAWPLTLPPPLLPPQPRRRESVPEWIGDLSSPLPADPRHTQSLPLSMSMSASLFSSLPPPLSNEHNSTWTSVTAASFSTSISHATASSSATLRVTANPFAAATSPSSALALLRTSSSSSSSSSSDSSSPSSSSPSASSLLASAIPPRRRYQRLTGLSHEQRMERRRQSHRELDAVRRQREALAISRLAELTATRTRTLTEQQPHSRSHSQIAGSPRAKQEDEMDVDTMETDEKGKRHRTAVLENSVEKLEELQNLIHQLTATCTQQSHDIAALRLQLQSAGVQPQPTSSDQPSSQTVPLLSASNIRRVVAEFGASSLYSALFVSPSVGLLLVDCATGVALDANERLLSGGLCSREDVVGRLVAPTYHAITTLSDWDTQPAAEPTNRMHVRGQPAMVYSQYGVTKESVLALYRGQVDQIYVVWRAQLGDGLAYELPLSSFVASRDTVEMGRPRTVLVSLSLSEAKRI